VRLLKSNNLREVKIDPRNKYINTGAQTHKVDEMPICSKIYSGQEAIDQLKKGRIK